MKKGRKAQPCERCEPPRLQLAVSSQLSGVLRAANCELIADTVSAPLRPLARAARVRARVPGGGGGGAGKLTHTIDRHGRAALIPALLGRCGGTRSLRRRARGEQATWPAGADPKSLLNDRGSEKSDRGAFKSDPGTLLSNPGAFKSDPWIASIRSPSI